MNMFNMDAKALHKARIYLIVILLQFGFAGFAIVAQFALDSGTSHWTFAVYRNAIAAVVFAPFALVFERKIRPKMTFNIFLRIIVLGLLDPVMGQNLFYAGMNLTTATFTSAMSNVLPALTFIMAWILRVEKVNVRKLSSQAKILGTIATVSGAMIMTLVAGPILGLPWTHSDSNSPPAPGSSSSGTVQNPARGALMIAAGNFGYALFYILQAVTLKSYPAGLSLTAMICASGALQGTVLTFIVERGNLGIWAIGLNSRLLAYAYGGIISSGVTYYVSGYIMKEKGPVFVTAFNPLNMIIVAILSSFIFAEQLVVGQIIGALVIVVGLYLVIWGTIKDQRAISAGAELPLQQRNQLDVNPATKEDVQAIDVEVLQKVSGDSRLLKRSFSVNVGTITTTAKKNGDNLTMV